jgi:iron complex outermembrane receptor protein
MYSSFVGGLNGSSTSRGTARHRRFQRGAGGQRRDRGDCPTTLGETPERHIESITDLAAVVPGMVANGSLGRNVPIFSLRGISLRDPSFNQDGPIAAYYDDVYKGTFALLGVYMYDLERVEVLKGPQGTLYGKNTTGGAINMIGHSPGPNLDGYLKLGYGNYDHTQAEGAVNLPVTNDLFTRVAFVVDRDHGWAKNVAPGEPNLSSTDDFGVRGSLLYKPSDGFDFTLRAYYSRRDPYYDAPSPVPGPLGIGRGVYELFGGMSDFRAGLDRRTNDEPFPVRDPATEHSISGVGNVHLGDALTLTSVSSWDDGKIHVVGSPDGSYLRVIEVDYFARTKQVSQEFRLSSNGEGSFNFITGLYYNRETTDVLAENRFFRDIDVSGDGLFNVNDCKASVALKLAPVACGQRNSYDQVKTSTAAYTDSSYEITPAIKLRGGLRFTHDTGSLDNFYAQLVGAGDSIPLINTIPGSTTNLFATTGLGFQTNNVSG